jgi:hypothetical protein
MTQLFKIVIWLIRMVFSFGTMGTLAASATTTKKLLDDSDISDLERMSKSLKLNLSALETQYNDIEKRLQSGITSADIIQNYQAQLTELNTTKQNIVEAISQCWKAKYFLSFSKLFDQTLTHRPTSILRPSLYLTTDHTKALKTYQETQKTWEDYLSLLQKNLALLPRIKQPITIEGKATVINEVTHSKDKYKTAFHKEISNTHQMIELIQYFVTLFQTKKVINDLELQDIENKLKVLNEMQEFEGLQKPDELNLNDILIEIQNIHKTSIEIDNL